MKKIFILTGEPSGDKLAYTVISKLRQINPNIEYSCVGGTYLDSLNIIYPKSPGNMGYLDSAHVHISDTLTYTYAPLLINVNYNPYDSTIKNAVLEFEGQGKRNAKFNTGLILESGNLTLRNKASIYIGFWNSYLTRF